jgi:hypothetical protein
MACSAEKPRMVKKSPQPRLPSPEVKVMPGTFCSTSCRLWAFCSRISSEGTTLMLCGVSRNGWVSLGDCTAWGW